MGDNLSLPDRVLAEATRLFDELRSQEQYPVIQDAQAAIGAVLSMPPSHISVVLRSLHRHGKIGLMNGKGVSCTITPDQASMGQVSILVISDPGRRPTRPTIKPGRLRIETEEEDEKPSSDQLWETIAALMRQVEVLTGEKHGLASKLATALNRATKAKEQLRILRGEKEATDREVRRLRTENRQLREKITATPAPVLAEPTQDPQLVSDEMAERIHRLFER